MSSDLIFGVAAAAFGGCLTALGSYTALRDLRAGVVKGRVNSFRRESSPVSYSLAIFATLLTALVGLAFLFAGMRIVVNNWA